MLDSFQVMADHLLSPVGLACLLALSSFGPLAWKYVVVLRADDVRWDRDRCAAKNIDYAKAQRRSVSWRRLGLPLWLLVAAAYVGLMVWPSWRFYELVAVAAFVTTPLRKIWGMAVARQVYRRQNDGRNPETSFWQDVSLYYEWGFTFPERLSEPWFEDRWLFLNNFQRFWWLLRMWRSYGYILVQAVSCSAWLVVAPFMPFYHMDMVDDRNYTRPPWRFDRDSGRPAHVIPGEVLSSETASAPAGDGEASLAPRDEEA